VGPRVLQLVSIGNAPLSLLRELEPPLTTQLGLTVGYGKPALTSPAYAFNKDRNQYHSNAIMRRLAPLVDRDSTVLGVTDVDLFVPDSPFVFGEADRESRVAILSVARLRQGADDATFRRRVPGRAPGGAELLRGRALRDVRRHLAGRRGSAATVALSHLPERAGEALALSAARWAVGRPALAA
jgi:archaemetzincin